MRRTLLALALVAAVIWLVLPPAPPADAQPQYGGPAGAGLGICTQSRSGLTSAFDCAKLASISGTAITQSAVYAASTTSASRTWTLNEANSNATTPMLELIHTNSGGGTANGFGTSLAFTLETSANGTTQSAGYYKVDWSDATDATATARFRLALNNLSLGPPAAGSEQFEVLGVGQLVGRTADAATATVSNGLLLEHTTSGTPAANYGTGILLRGQDASNSAGGDDLGLLDCHWTTATSGSEVSTCTLRTRAAGAALSASNQVALSHAGMRIDNSSASASVETIISNTFCQSQAGVGSGGGFVEYASPNCPVILNSNSAVVTGGGDQGTPAALTVRGPNGVGTNKAGVATTYQASLGTGTGTCGTLVFNAGPSKQASGSTAHTTATYMTVGHGQAAHPGANGALIDYPAVTWNDENTAGSGTAAEWGGYYFQRPTLTARNTSVTTTTAATVTIANSPLASTNQTITNAVALRVKAGSARFDNRMLGAQGANVASAGNVTLGGDGNVFIITGTTTINCIDTAGWTAGSFVVLEFSGALTITDNSGACSGTNKAINIGAAYTTSADDTLAIMYDGTNWKEFGRSVN
jgi:hypothetical protein